MPTRFYFEDPITNNSTPNIAPIPGAGWDNIVNLTRGTLKLKRGNTDFTYSIGSSATNDLYLQYISFPLAPQTLAGTVMGVFRTSETVIADDRCAQFRAYVVDPTGRSVKGVLYEMDNSALSSEANTSLQNRFHPRGGVQTISSLAVTKGDRLIVEIGVRNFSGNANTYTFNTMSNQAVDLAANETDVAAGNSWVEFSQTIQFDEPRPMGGVM
jgi:hypothetical protein